MPLLSLSYDRLVCVFWAVGKSQEQRISALDSRVTALEAEKTRRNYETHHEVPTELPQRNRKVFLAPSKCTSKSKHLEEASIQDFKKAYMLDRRRSSILRSRKVFTKQARPYSQSEERSLQWLQLCYKSMLIIKCGSQANRLGTLGGRQEDS